MMQAKGSSAWQVLDEGIQFPRIRSITYDPGRGIYVGTYAGGVYRSRDAGRLWEPMSQGFPNSDVRFLVQDTGQTLYAGTEKGVYRGDRKRRRWVRLEGGPGHDEITALWMAEANRLLAGSPRGFYETKVGPGAEGSEPAWSRIDLESADAGIVSIAPGKGAELFAATPRRVYRQASSGRSWKPVRIEAVDGPIRGLAVADTLYLWSGTAIYRGERTSKGSYGWRPISQSIPSGTIIHDLRVQDSGRKTRLFAGTSRGLFWSHDGGRTWSRAEGRLGGVPVEVLYAPSREVLILGSASHGVLFGINLLDGGILPGIL